MKARFPVIFFLLVANWSSPMESSWAQAKSPSHSTQVASAERKLEQLERNGGQTQPDPSPTEFTEQEVNAYFASGHIKLPAGVQSVIFQGQPQIVVGTSRVDFDQVKAGRNSYNPLLSVFSGVHDVVVTTHAYGARGEGVVHVDSVSIDGIEVPKFVLELFVEKYLKPRYPNIGIDSRFPLPARVESAIVGLHKVSLTQK
jgi:hypothetical protein